MSNRIQIRRDTAANWTSVNPVLAQGEAGLETDTGRRKTGDGTTAWTALGYAFDKTIADATYITPGAANAAYAPITGSVNYIAPSQLDAAQAANISDSSSVTATALNAAYVSPSKIKSKVLWSDAYPPVHPTPPTVTYSTTATMTSGRTIVSPADPRIRKIGDPGVMDNPSGRLAIGSKTGAIEFYIDNTDRVELSWYELVANGCMVWLLVDDMPITPTPSLPIATGNAQRIFTYILFSTPGRHKITLYGSLINGWGWVSILNGASIYPTAPRPRLGIVGDSFGDGNAYCHQALCAPMVLARSIGMELALDCIGGTGYVNPGGTGTNTYGSAARVAEMVRRKPDALIIWGGINDSAAGLATAYTATFDAYKAALPNVSITVFGPQPSSAVNTIAQARADVNKIIHDAAIAHPQVIGFIDQIGTADGIIPAAWNIAVTTYQAGDKVTYLGSVWAAASTKGSATGAPGASTDWTLLSSGYYGTGTLSAPTGDGSRDTVLGGDGTHPTPLGAKMLASIMAQQFVQALSGTGQAL